MKVLIIDNYDSFTYNLYQYSGEVLKNRHKKFVLDVKRNNKISLYEIRKESYDKIIISPGPGTPEDPNYFGVCFDVIKTLANCTPILGICLGMQGIAYVYGSKIIKAKVPMHGKTSIIENDSLGVFQNVPKFIEVMRYHSLLVDEDNLASCFHISARTLEKEGGEIMAIRHKTYPLEGIQFHPESFATEAGKQMIANFLI